MPGPWRSRPVFISSTFKDMHAERDYLRHHVFPRLEEALRRRRHNLEPIDLRLGVETAEAGSEEARELLVLKVCLDEIRRSRPYLIVLLGDRYGWVPPEERITVAAQEAGFQTEVTGKSVTALEIEFGILQESPDQRRRSFFYFRDPLPYDEMPPDLAAQYSDLHSPDPRVRQGHDKLRALKARLAGDPELAPRVHRFSVRWDEAASRVTGLDTWGEMVYQHLWKDLEEETGEFAAEPAPTWEEEEREALAEFIAHRTRDFVGRENLLAELQALARSTAMEGASWAACITGEPGSGKSALFAELFQRLSNDPGVFVLANAAGGTPRGAQVDSMLRRWIQELADSQGIPNPLQEKASPDDVDTAFAQLLRRAAGDQRVVVMLDALDQFEPTPRGTFLTWLRPKQWPENARLMATSLPGTQADTLCRLPGVDQRTLPPLTVHDAEAIGRNVWTRYHRQLNPEVMRVLAGKRLPGGAPAAGNPLWLTLALEQLNLLDADDFARAEREFSGTPVQRLHALLLDAARRMPPDVEGLYGWLLAQNEKVFGEAFTRAFAGAIALGRFGRRDNDLLGLVPRLSRLLFPDSAADGFDVLRLAALRRGFRAHLVRRGAAGQLDMFHAQIRRAVLRRALGDKGLESRAHGAIADHLESLPAEDPLRESELMVHIIGNGDQTRAASCYAGLTVALGSQSGATQALARHILAGAGQPVNPNLAWVVGLLDQPDLGNLRIAGLANRFVFDLHDSLENIADLETRRLLLEAALRTHERLTAADPSNAGWQRDLWGSYWRMAHVCESTGSGDAVNWWRKAYEVLFGMKQRGLFISRQDEGYLEHLRRRAGV